MVSPPPPPSAGPAPRPLRWLGVFGVGLLMGISVALAFLLVVFIVEERVVPPLPPVHPVAAPRQMQTSSALYSSGGERGGNGENVVPRSEERRGLPHVPSSAMGAGYFVEPEKREAMGADEEALGEEEEWEEQETRSIASSSPRSMRQSSRSLGEQRSSASVRSAVPRSEGVQGDDRVSRSSAKPSAWAYPVRFTWPTPTIPAFGEAVVGRIVLQNSCAGPLTIQHLLLLYRGPRPFLIRGVRLLRMGDEGDDLAEQVQLSTTGEGRGWEVFLPLDPPVEIASCMRETRGVAFEDRDDILGIDVVVEAGDDRNDWTAHTFLFSPEGVGATGEILWGEEINPAEGVFQFFTGQGPMR